jgi:acetolactate synthase I/II/III large subunit
MTSSLPNSPAPATAVVAANAAASDAPASAASATGPGPVASARNPPAVVNRTTGQALVDGLLAHGVDTLFGIPGVQTYPLYDALAEVADQITVYGPRHEQAAAYMAFGYAQATGRPGVYSVVPGPGVLNASAAVLSAYGASAPLVGLTSEIPSNFMGRGLGHLHEMPDQLATMRTFNKWADNISHPAETAEKVAEAFHQATSGRPRPVALAAPWDVLAHTAPAAACTPRPTAVSVVDPLRIERAAALLAKAKNPMIMVGGGARSATSEVTALAEFLQAPVVSLRGGRGVVSDEHPLGFTCAEGFERWGDCDLLMGIGCRLELVWSRWPDRPANLPIVLIDIDPQQFVRLQATVGILADAPTGSAALLGAAVASMAAAADRSAEFGAIKVAKRAEVEELQPHIGYLDALRRALPRDGFLVEEICQVGFASYYGFPVYEPRTFVTCGHQGTLGFGYPTSLGVKAAFPDRAVVSINGDGGFMFGIQELATAVEYNLGVVAVVFNNHAYGNVLNDQRRLYGRSLGSELKNPDFVGLAHAFGASGCHVATPAELEVAVSAAIDANAPTVIEVAMPLDATASPWRFLMPQSRR